MQDLSTYLFLTHVTMQNKTKFINIPHLKEYFQNIKYFSFMCWKIFFLHYVNVINAFSLIQIQFKGVVLWRPARKDVSLRVSLSKGSEPISMRGSEKIRVYSLGYAYGRHCVPTRHHLSASLKCITLHPLVQPPVESETELIEIQTK